MRNVSFQGPFEGRARWSDVRKHVGPPKMRRKKAYASDMRKREKRHVRRVMVDTTIKAFIGVPLNKKLTFEDIRRAEKKLGLPIIRLRLNAPLPKDKFRIARVYERLSKIALAPDVQAVINRAVDALLLK